MTWTARADTLRLAQEAMQRNDEVPVMRRQLRAFITTDQNKANIAEKYDININLSDIRDAEHDELVFLCELVGIK